MKRIAILVSALFLAAPALAQDKSTTREPSTNPNPNVQDDKRSNSDMPAKTDSAVPTKEDRAQNRDTVSGATLTGKVKSALAADVGLKTVTGIDVDSDKGVVTLKGKVDTADQKKRAETVAKKVSGVKSVKNQLTVGG
jgi:osmotically-inducible protein OsmY